MAGKLLEELGKFGQSIWLDNISRSLIESGRLRELIKAGLRGITSNPTIFDKAISLSCDYDAKIEQLCSRGKTVFQVYDELTVSDVQEAAVMFGEVYKKTRGLDGYVSLEVSPKLAFEAEATIEEAKRLHEKVGRPNLMVKVPATREGFRAIEELLSLGINVNATLIFSAEQYVNTARAYLRGINKLVKNGGNLKDVRSVASVFVSRLDTAVDKILDELLRKDINSTVRDKLNSLKGRAAVANCSFIYQKYSEIFSSGEFLRLKEKGANLQRVLWASTSTKNPAYNDIKYVLELMAKDTVNTLPADTLEAFLDHGVVKEAVFAADRKPVDIIKNLKDAGIDVSAVCDKLLSEGVAAFEKSFDSLLNSIEEKLMLIRKK